MKNILFAFCLFAFASCTKSTPEKPADVTIVTVEGYVHRDTATYSTIMCSIGPGTSNPHDSTWTLVYNKKKQDLNLVERNPVGQVDFFFRDPLAIGLYDRNYFMINKVVSVQ